MAKKAKRAVKKAAGKAKKAVKKAAGKAKSAAKRVAAAASPKWKMAGAPQLIPYLVVRDCARALEFYKTAFGATEVQRMPLPDGKILHAQLQIGDSAIFFSDEDLTRGNKSPHALGGTAGSVMIYFPNVDEVFQRAVQAGATMKAPLMDMFWGDRWGLIEDPFGHAWQLATHKEDLTDAEMAARAQQMGNAPAA